jgi:uncharacterized lipoprotein YajG
MNTFIFRSLAAVPLLLGVAVSIALLAGCSHNSANAAAAAPPPPTVSVAEVV